MRRLMPQEFTVILDDEDVRIWTAYCAWTQVPSQVPSFPPAVSVASPQDILERLVEERRRAMQAWAAQYPEAL
jgi:hypothetical protein